MGSDTGSLLHYQVRLISPILPFEGSGMPSSGIPSLDRILGGGGYPDGSAILVSGPAGIGKESLGYFFTQVGLDNDDLCLYVTRLSIREVLQDEGAFGIRPSKTPVWFARYGGQVRLDINDLDDLTRKVEAELTQNQDRRARVVLDVLSPILMLNIPEATYKFVDRLVECVKRHDAVLIATLEEGMHPPQTLAAMQHLFDGVIEFSFFREGLKIQSLLRVIKMRGRTPSQEFHPFSFTRSGIQLGRGEVETGAEVAAGPAISTSSLSILQHKESKDAFDFLVNAFVEDYMKNKMSIEQSGWRTRIAIAEATGVASESFYGKEGRFGPVLKELLSSGLVETRFFSGQRGRGGEVTKIRVAYDKAHVKRMVDETVRNRSDNT